MGFALLKKNLPNYTYADYCQWEGRWELIDGIPYAMSPLPTGKHQWVSFALASQFHEQLSSCKKCEVSLPMDWKIGENTVLQPDLFVACFDFKNKKYITQTPVLVVEVLSPSNSTKDMEVKSKIYAHQGVKYYLIVEPKNDTYKIYKLNTNGYKLVKSGHKGNYMFELDFCKAEIDFDALWASLD